eukprot:TRINITY_DN1076_c0_g1_i1.p1 TRINITY_DN1076_c0_g1~~TRINITY_DN1076_c0_g1_i1.p1  ORF type:complete len:479 (+),score=172.71 TRINITY_DN1076_c0_g1_i1:48-1484(+)
MRTAVFLGLLAAAAAASDFDIPASCKVSIVGSGYSGSYFAWRLAVDTHRYKASDVCVFEANDRVGGRVYTVRDYPEMEDLEIELGAYRFDSEDKLPADLITKALRLDSRCYGNNCTGVSCHWWSNRADTCMKVADIYGNARYSQVIETMLEQLKSAGAQVFRGVTVKGVHEGSGIVWRTGKKRAVLTFVGRPERVQTDVVLVNSPLSAMSLFDSDSVMFPNGGGNPKVAECLALQEHLPGVKAYALYQDAWWYSKLGKSNGDFGHNNETIPLAGRYSDGAVKCRTGTGPDGKPVYADGVVLYGDCKGALLVFYEVLYVGAPAPQNPFWYNWATQHEDPLTRTVAGDGNDAVLGQLHDELMAFHAADFAAAGVNPSTIAPPTALYVGSFLPEGTYVGTLSGTACARTMGSDLWKLVRRPNADYDVFFANQDYAYDDYTQQGWATGGLQLAEKILQAEMDLRRPRWLNKTWYEEKILSVA